MNRKYHFGIQCPTCRMRMFSWHRHDFRSCFCGDIFVDGGFDYLRAGCSPGTKPVTVRWTPDDWAPDWYIRGEKPRQREFMW